MQANNIGAVLEKFYERQITSREQAVNEMLRMKLTEKANMSDIRKHYDSKMLYQLMKQTTENDLGYFPADEDFFVEIYNAFKEIDPLEFVVEIYKNDKSGVIIPKCITDYMTKIAIDSVTNIIESKILITEAEKHLSGLTSMIQELRDATITLATHLYPIKLLLELIFDGISNVKIINESIYSNCLDNQMFDYICCIPGFGSRVDNSNDAFFTKDSEGIALENMSCHLSERGRMAIVLPAKVTFSGSGYAELRRHIASRYSIESLFLMPDGVFRPYSAIKTYLLTISKTENENITIGALAAKQEKIIIEEEKNITKNEFFSHEDWRIEMMIAEDDAHIQRFINSLYSKAKLSEIAEVFRGKSILKKDVSVGKVAILNISNIQEGEIDYDNMDTIDEDIRKNKRYELEDGDVVLSCRGTALKVAVFRAQERDVIASANVIIIRSTQQVLGEFIKVFLESPVGQAIIKSFQRGTTVINFNHSDVMEMEIPLLPLEKQREIIAHYNDEQNRYKETIRTAQEQWDNVKQRIYNQLI